VFAFFADPRNLTLITPPWLRLQLVGPPNPIMGAGLELTYRVRPMLVPVTWVSEITTYESPHRFVDEQRHGPYASWHHEHSFRAVRGGTEVSDVVRYRLPFGTLGRIAHACFVRRRLWSIFVYRAAVIRSVFDAQPV
jgi:ligand-binding SRPBCC domain-containing protein